MIATGTNVEIGGTQLIAAIVALSGVVWWYMRESNKGKLAAERERAAVTREALDQAKQSSDAAVKQAEKASDAAVKTAESIGKLAEAVSAQSEILRSHHEQSMKDHAEICRVVHGKT